MCSHDKRRDALCIMLDMSPAFDTIDHNILVHRLHTKFGINGTAPKWLSSYLNRMQHVVVRLAMSDQSPVYCGILQVSVLGPVLPCMHTMPLEDIFAMVCSI